jgi:pimeloyl-ACP methyl ester carboxylesterase
MDPQPPRRTTHATAGPQDLIIYDRWGRSGRPVLLLHGLLFERSMWWPAAAELAAHCTVIAPDLPGHGQSPSRLDYSAERIAEELAGLVHDLGLRRAPVVVAHGTSARLALTFAEAYACHNVLAVDRPSDETVRTVDDLITAARLDDVPPEFRSFAEPSRDAGLLAAYDSWHTGPPLRLIASVTVAMPAEATRGPAGRERAFLHLSDPVEFAAAVRRLL